jgi:HEAT repeat protein
MGKLNLTSEASMTKRLCGTLVAILAVALPICLAQESKEIHLMFVQLNQPETSDAATNQIVRRVEKGAVADRDYVVERLPGMIDNPVRDKVWSNAVRLAGSLKAANAVPSLIRVLPTTPFQSPVAMPFADDLTLKYDPVGEALSEIGDAALSEIVKLLEHGDRTTRIRAARILWNIDSAASRKALRDDLDHEADPAIKRLTVGKSVSLSNQSK